jgi:hypothetical protein
MVSGPTGPAFADRHDPVEVSTALLERVAVQMLSPAPVMKVTDPVGVPTAELTAAE